MVFPPPGGLPSLPLDQSAAWLTAHRRLEEQVFELMGGWSKVVPEAEAKVLLAAHSHRHAWHARLWAERIPGAGAPLRTGAVGLADGAAPGWQDPASLVPSPERVDEVAQALGEIGSRGTVEKLAGVYRVVVPRLIVSYETRLATASEASDAPVVRALRLVVFDEVDGWREGERVLQGLVLGADEARRAAAAQAALEAVVAGGSGLAGPTA